MVARTRLSVTLYAHCFLHLNVYGITYFSGPLILGLLMSEVCHLMCVI